MSRVVPFASIILMFVTNFRTTHCDVRENLICPDYDGIDLSNLSIALGCGWCVCFLVLLVGLTASDHRRAEAGNRFRASIPAGLVRLFPYARLYIVAAPLAFGFRCTWYSETGQRYTSLSFGTGASVAPLILTIAAVTLLNVYMAVISRADCRQNQVLSHSTTC